MGAVLKIVIVAVLVLLAVALLGTIVGLYDSPAGSAQAAIEQMDRAPQTVASVDGDWKQSDVFSVLVPMLMAGGAGLGHTWPSPMSVVFGTFGAAFGIIGLVLLLKLLVKLLKAG